MEWVGWISLLIIVCYAAYPGKVKKLETKVARLERTQKGDGQMSKLISDLIGKSCVIKTEETEIFGGAQEIECDVEAADEEWVKLVYIDKKANKKIKIIRIDSIKHIELKSE